MTEQQQALATTSQQPQRRQIVLSDELQDMATRLKYLMVNGAKLQDVEVLALAQYAVDTQLDPFIGECFYLPGTGPIPGILAWRNKAQAQLDFEAQKAGAPFAEFNIVYELADPAEANFDPAKGDIAVKAVLTDTLSSGKWRKDLFESAQALRDLGMTPTEAYTEARKLHPDEPRWYGIGVVYGSENFSKPGQPEKMDRHERVMKRAEKQALKKRFPRLHLPEPEDGSSNHVETPDIRIMPPATLQSENRPPMTEAERLSELGFEDPQPAQQPAVSIYTGPLAKIGKNKYPAAWAALMMPKIIGAGTANEWQLDAALQAINMEQSTMPEPAFKAASAYLEAKKRGDEDPTLAAHDALDAINGDAQG